jgi:putative endonuclease
LREVGESSVNNCSIPTKVGIQKKNAGFRFTTEWSGVPYRRKSVSSKNMKDYAVYILASKRNGTLYVGFTNDLVKRVFEHKNDLVEGFTKKYGVHLLVYYETSGSYEGALQKQIKEWKREWKLELIERSNPEWRDLYEEIV